jgi:hypothetical protein
MSITKGASAKPPGKSAAESSVAASPTAAPDAAAPVRRSHEPAAGTAHAEAVERAQR